MTDKVQLEVGQQAPDFDLETATGERFHLAEKLAAAAKGVVVYFYPRAMTPGCTTEACDFRDSESALQAAGYTVVGVSPDKPEKLQRFIETYQLPFTLVSDPDRAVMQAYGAFGEKKNYGKIVQGVIRSTVVIGKDGTITHAWYNVRAKGHVGRICKELGITTDETAK